MAAQLSGPLKADYTLRKESVLERGNNTRAGKESPDLQSGESGGIKEG